MMHMQSLVKKQTVNETQVSAIQKQQNKAEMDGTIGDRQVTQGADHWQWTEKKGEKV